MTYRIPLDPNCETAHDEVESVIADTVDDEVKMEAAIEEWAVRHRQECRRCREYGPLIKLTNVQ